MPFVGNEFPLLCNVKEYIDIDIYSLGIIKCREAAEKGSLLFRHLHPSTSRANVTFPFLQACHLTCLLRRNEEGESQVSRLSATDGWGGGGSEGVGFAPHLEMYSSIVLCTSVSSGVVPLSKCHYHFPSWRTAFKTKQYMDL